MAEFAIFSAFGLSALTLQKLSSPSGILNLTITGFGPFQGVVDNPSSRLVNDIKTGKLKTPEGVTIDFCETVEVSAVGSKEVLDQLYSRPSQRAGKQMYLHLGVHGQAKTFHVERRAWNETNFRCTDERGWQPKSTAIDGLEGGVSASRQTILPVESIVASLNAHGFGCQVSDDPGRFVCNWIYYNSLTLAEDKSPVLFLHIPTFEVINEAAQLKFLEALIAELAKVTV